MKNIAITGLGLHTRMRSIDTRSSPIAKTLYGLDMLWVSWRFLRYNRWEREYGLDSFFRGPEIKRLFISEESFLASVQAQIWLEKAE